MRLEAGIIGNHEVVSMLLWNGVYCFSCSTSSDVFLIVAAVPA
jgi:hypothetical protein